LKNSRNKLISEIPFNQLNIRQKYVQKELKVKAHGFSVDFEEWFHILDCNSSPSVNQWNYLEPRINLIGIRLLDFLDRYKIRGTFFILGWVAQRYPELIQEIVRRKHEIGTHGHMHLMVSELSPDEFARDLDTSIMAIYRAANCDVYAYRAPGFSISNRQFWAFDILASRGIYLDSSLFLGLHTHGGSSLKRTKPFPIILSNYEKIIEVPIVPLSLIKMNLPFSGGGYLRLLPTQLINLLYRLFENDEIPVITYIHPRELDLKQPRMNLPWFRYFKYYIGIDTFPRKIERLFENFVFKPLGDIANNTPLDRPLYIKNTSHEFF
jgi:polysaccharide deacetylase family protein (PEP-CTERM system associated)